MTLTSMTGYARADGAHAGRTWYWEIRSVNGRALDVRCRLPQGYDELDRAVRAALAQALARGNVSVTLAVTETMRPAVAFDTVLLDQLVDAGRRYAASAGLPAPSLDALLSLRGVVEVAPPTETEADKAARETAIKASLDQAIAALIAARREEGLRLTAVLTELLDELDRLVEAAAATAAVQPARLRAKLFDQVREMVGAEPRLSEERLNQEVALLLVKADVREELDRLRAHIAQARALFANGATVGRRLDFLTQELNREANTLCSKASDIELTRIGLDLKTAIDRIREQVQNIE